MVVQTSVRLWYRLCLRSHRLVVPSTGHDVLEDIKDLFKFLADGFNPALEKELSSRSIPPFHVNTSAIAVAGTSAGGLCAYLSAMHATPKPVALLSMYGMGGNFLTDHHLKPKTKPFWRGWELLDPEKFREYLFPNSCNLPPIAESPQAYHPQDSPTPGFPANPRMFLTRLLLQQGTFLDYYTGDHEPSLSETLGRSLDWDTPKYPESVIPQNHISLFPQFGVSSHWPPTFLVHGAADTAIPVDGSQHMRDLLEAAAVDVTLKIVEGQEHSFDYVPNAAELYGDKDGLFDEMVAFLLSWLKTD